jgi:hypothetical protein
MPNRDNASTGRRPSPGASPVRAGRPHSAGAKSVVIFTALSDTQWEAIRSTRENWPEDVDWRRAIERIGQDYWELRASKEMWVNGLRGKQLAKQREKIRKAGTLMRRLQKVLAELADELGDDFLPSNLNLPEPQVKEWLSEYNFWVRPFAGQSDPIQSELERRLMNLWKRSGEKLRWSRKKDNPGTPYGPLVDFLTHTLYAILGKALKPSGVAKLIDRHRGQKVHTYLMVAMATRTEIAAMPWDQE